MGKLGTFTACLVGGLALLGPVRAHAQQAPDFTLKDLSGQSRTLSRSYAGKVILVDFWATWCVPCVKELPHLQGFQDRYGAKGLHVLAVSTDGPDRLAAVASFVGRYSYTFPVLLDSRSEVVALFDPQLVLPFNVLLDRNGRIRFVHQGYSPGDERLLEKEIVQLLEEVPSKPRSKTALRANESFLLRLPSGSPGQGGPAEGNSRVINQLDLTVSNGRFLA